MEKKLGAIEGLFIAPPDLKGFPRPSREKLELVGGLGIVGDRFFDKEPNRAVLIIGRDSYKIAKEHGIELADGSFGENVIFDFDPHTLKIGAKLRVGEVELEVSEKCTICNHLSIFGELLPKIIKGHRGVYCKVNRGGVLSKGIEAFEILSGEDILMMDRESLKLYNLTKQYPNHFMRLKTLLLVKECKDEDALECEMRKLEESQNPMDAMDEYAEYPDFVLSGYVRTVDGAIDMMGGAAKEIELTLPTSNSSFLQILSERLKSILNGNIYICAAIDIIDMGSERSSFWENISISQKSSNPPQNAMMDEGEWAIFDASYEDGEYQSIAWNMGIFVIKKEKQLAKIVGFYP